MIEDLVKKINECESKNDGEFEKMIQNYPVLTMEEEKILFSLYDATNDKTYKDIIFKCHIRDVYEACDDDSNYRADLISEGIVMLYEYIDLYDNKMPYTTFKNNLLIRLKVLFNELKEQNNKSLDTKMSTQELKSLEEKGKCLTDTNEVEEVQKEVEPLVIIINEGLTIVPNSIKKTEAKKIFDNIFKDNPWIKKSNKLLNLRLHNRYKPEDTDY